MNKSGYVSLIFFYILFTQIFPYFHWHDHLHAGENRICLSIHPAQDTDQHKSNHSYDDDHQADDNHFSGDWQNVTQPVNDNMPEIRDNFHANILLFAPDLSEIQFSIDRPPKFPISHIVLYKPSRAAPFLI